MDEKYKEYLQSEEWRKKASQIKSDKNHKCEICGNQILIEVIKIIKDPFRESALIEELNRFTETIEEKNWDKNKLIQVHHKTYENIYQENQDELACLCHPCHVFFHEATQGNHWKKAWDLTLLKVSDLCEEIEQLDKRDWRLQKIDFSIGLTEDPFPEPELPIHLFPEIDEDETDWESSDDPIEL